MTDTATQHRQGTRRQPSTWRQYWACLAMWGLGLATVAGEAGAADAPVQCRAVSEHTCRVANQLGRGINLAGMLDAPREGDFGVRVEQRFIDAAASRFATVRLPIRWSNHAAVAADATIDPLFFARVDSIANQLLASGKNVILDFHSYSQLTGRGLYRNELPVDAAVVQTRFINIWRQISEHYRDWPANLLFEIYNEPYGALEGEAWNRLLADVMPVIRQANPERTVLVGPGQWNAPRALATLRIPVDRNVIVTVHHYDPFDFTHQGADWVGRPMATHVSCCDATQRSKLIAGLDQAKRWADTHGYPIHVGEFGAIDKASMASRIEYTTLMRKEMESRGFSWSYFSLVLGFAVFDAEKSAWVPGLIDALLPDQAISPVR